MSVDRGEVLSSWLRVPTHSAARMWTCSVMASAGMPAHAESASARRASPKNSLPSGPPRASVMPSVWSRQVPPGPRVTSAVVVLMSENIPPIDVRRQPLSAGDAIMGLTAYLNALRNVGSLTNVQILGNDFDLDWKAGK